MFSKIWVSNLKFSSNPDILTAGWQKFLFFVVVTSFHISAYLWKQPMLVLQNSNPSIGYCRLPFFFFAG